MTNVMGVKGKTELLSRNNAHMPRTQPFRFSLGESMGIETYE
ncbi:hypothetical protein K3495_g6106 [Podosphaera aphanis]|nr:hypothetical protein K3495_g6106 [Podosphaera aphanis]